MLCLGAGATDQLVKYEKEDLSSVSRTCIWKLDMVPARNLCAGEAETGRSVGLLG